MTDKIVSLAGITFHYVELNDIMRLTEMAVNGQNKFSILYLNHHIYNLCLKNTELKNAIVTSNNVHIDGIGIWLGLKLFGYKEFPRFNWTDNAIIYLKYCAVKDYSLFFFGGDPNILRSAEIKLRDSIPNLKIKGMIDGFTSLTDDEIIARINEAKPNILWVGLGSPRQELWIFRNIDRLNINIIQSTGDIMSELAGIKKRGPKYLQKAGFEWVVRLIYNPVK